MISRVEKGIDPGPFPLLQGLLLQLLLSPQARLQQNLAHICRKLFI
jgi:hypothetical protein